MTSLSPPPSPGAPPFTGRLGSIASSCIRSTQLPAHSILLSWYTSFLACASIYSVVATPLLIVFPLARYDGHAAVEACLDAAFTLGVIIKLRTTYVSRDGTSHSAAFSACQYLKGQFTVDALGALPFEPIASAIFSSADREGLLWLHLLRAFRGLYILRRLRSLRGANVVRVVQMLAGFLIFAHYLGLFWYALVVWPLQEEQSVQSLRPWLWHNETVEDSAALYVCSLYWT